MMMMMMMGFGSCIIDAYSERSSDQPGGGADD
jgi:hypothetical protein